MGDLVTRKDCSYSSIFSQGAGGMNLPSSLRVLDIKESTMYVGMVYWTTMEVKRRSIWFATCASCSLIAALERYGDTCIVYWWVFDRSC